MTVTLVMTVIGADRPGLVGKLASAVADHGGNWLESRMAHLGGQFAGILRVEVSADRKAPLVVALEKLAPAGLTVRVQETQPPSPPPTQTLVLIEVVGHDRPGIVKQISQVLAALQINVEELITHTASAPMSGETHFHATATVQLPADCPLSKLRQALEAIATDLMVDISLAPA